jgi:hypothetical protein
MSKLTFERSADLYNMVLGGLIALSSDQKIGKLARKASSENLFLGRWLKRCKKQKCYPKSLSGDIDNLLQIYTREGRTGNLAFLFRRIYCEFQLLNNVPQKFTKTEKQRFDKTMSCLADDDWFISLPISHNKDSDTPYRPTREKELFTSMCYWDGAFNEQNELTKPLSIFVISAPQEVIDCFYENGFVLANGLSSNDNEGNCYQQYEILPNNNCDANLAIPTEFQI